MPETIAIVLVFDNPKVAWLTIKAAIKIAKAATRRQMRSAGWLARRVTPKGETLTCCIPHQEEICPSKIITASTINSSHQGSSISLTVIYLASISRKVQAGRVAK